MGAPKGSRAGKSNKRKREFDGSGSGKGAGKGKATGEDGADEEVPASKLRTSDLHLAGRNGEIAKIKALLADKATAEDVKCQDKHKRTPLHLAAFFGHVSAVEALVDGGADANKEATDGFTALHFAAQQGHIEVLRALIRKVGAKREQGDHSAVKRYVNRVVMKGKKTALHMAVQKGHADCARFLALKGASVDAQTAEGKTVLELCQSEELRRDLESKSKAAAETEAVEAQAQAANDAASGAAAGEPAEKRAKQDGDAPAKEDAASAGSTGGGAGMTKLPVTPPEMAQAMANVLRCGPFPMARLSCTAAAGNKSYPAGVAALANVQWSFAIRQDKTMQDGPVWCVASHEVEGQGAGRSVKITLQKSTKKLMHYTHCSDEGKMLPKKSWCNPCGLTILAETADGLFTLEKKPSDFLDGSDVAAALKKRLANFGVKDEDCDAVVAGAQLLALLDRGEDAPDCRLHELLLGVRLPAGAAGHIAGTLDSLAGDAGERTGIVDATTKRGLLLLKALREAA
eukprot:TRINITY_DN93160_c0_g1_i1.p1 TRINITY_DN93160_c0_g1~~TRINITY_DN93160_c0_g1_i1.p1  ORF type:complete len:515 (+),score=164.96 TRINITY_DN93160_c0_g1_i1:110-1654(+)